MTPAFLKVKMVSFCVDCFRGADYIFSFVTLEAAVQQKGFF